jgi:hypothetical protein
METDLQLSFSDFALFSILNSIVRRQLYHVVQLGRGLINAQPWPDRRKLDEREVVSRELVAAGCHALTMLDLIEEPLDQVSGAVQIRAEADQLVAIASWRNIGPIAPLGGKRSNPVGIMTTISERHCP